MLSNNDDQCPLSKVHVTDLIFKKIIQSNGGHQYLIDISRCINLSSKNFQNLNACLFLWYLDISYTKVTDIYFLSSCIYLRGLNLAGIQLIGDSSY